MAQRQLEIRHDDGTVTICDLDVEARTFSEARHSEPALPENSPLDFAVARYDIDAVVGRGGFATVVRAFDQQLGRVVALKIPRREPGGLRAEGALAARLQHPNIVPVYDAGEAEGGSPFYVMKLLDGSSMSAVIKQIANGDEAMRARYSDARLLEVFRQVCLAVQYAHDQGVLHRDIKPANIVLGQYGEVVLADWGIARRLDGDEDEGGLLRGTLAYMAPERLDSNLEGSIASDIYALGAVLFELLTFVPLWRGTREEILSGILGAPPKAPSELGVEVSTRLEALCMSMLATDPARRPARAEDVAEVIAAHLDAERNQSARKARATASFAQARQAFNAYQQAVKKMTKLEERVEAFAAELGHDTSPKLRLELWRLQAEAADSRAEREVMFGRAVTAFEHVLHDDEDHTMARAGLAELHLERLAEAEESGDRIAAAGIEQFVFAAGYRPASARLTARAEVTLRCSTHGAAAALFEFRPLGPVLELVDRVDQQTVPARFELKPGSYAVELRAPEHVTMWVPFVTTRGGRVSLSTRMYRDDQVPPDFVVVTGLDHDVAFGRHPVTVGEFLRFVNAQPHDEAMALFDEEVGTISRYFSHDESAGWTLRLTDADGDRWDLDWPMLLISRNIAESYAAWAASVSGFPMRLPTKQEWEWAAGGCDGRQYPWGHGVDAGCANLRTNLDTRALPEPVGSYPVDRSPFGVFDMGGGMTEWTSTVDEASGAGILKGASYNAPPDSAQISISRTARPTEGFGHYGMRMCCTLETT